MGHPLDDWVASLRPLRYRDLEALTIDQWDLVGREGEVKAPKDWSANSVRLARMIFRPSAAEIATFRGEQDVDGPFEAIEAEEDMPPEERERLSAWRCSGRSLLRGARTPVGESRLLFAVDLEIDSPMMSSVWGWTARSFTENLAIVSEWDDTYYNLQLFPKPLGLVSTRSLYRSTALLLRNHPDVGFTQSRFKKGGFWDGIGAIGIEVPELYRLLLAREGHCTDDVLDMESKDLPRFRAPGADHGFEDVLLASRRVAARSDLAAPAKALSALAYGRTPAESRAGANALFSLGRAVAPVSAPLREGLAKVIDEAWHATETARADIVLGLAETVRIDPGLLTIEIAAAALALEGEDGVTALLALRDVDDPSVRSKVVLGLSLLERSARWAVPTLIRSLRQEPAGFVSGLIIHALGRIGGRDAVAELKRLLTDAEDDMDWERADTIRTALEQARREPGE